MGYMRRHRRAILMAKGIGCPSEMARLKSRSPLASRRYQTLEVSDLTGGIDLRRSISLVSAERARTLLNVSLTNPGELVMRPGYLAFSTTNLGNSRIQGGGRIYLGSTTMTRIAWNGAVYGVSDAGILNSTALYSTVSDVTEVYFPYDRELVAVLDGVNRPRKSTDGVTWTRMGIDEGPPSTVSGGSSAGAMSTSEFEVAYAYKDRGTGHLSNGSSGSTISFTSSGTIAVQVPNSSDAQVDAIVLYARNKTAGETVFRRVSSAAIQGGASSTYTINSSAWSANSEMPTNHQVPVALTYAVSWKNRWWGLDPTVGNRIRFTELFRNQAWPSLYFIDIPFERGDEITAIVPQGDTLIVFGQSKVFVIIGQTSLDFEVRPSAGAQAGCFGPRAVAVIENGVVHAAAEGVFIFDGASDRYLSFDIEPAWQDLLINSAASALSRIAMTYHFPTKELRIAVPRRYPSGVVGEFVLDLNRTREQEQPSWTATDRTIGGYIICDGDEQSGGAQHRGRLFSWHSSTQATLWVESTGTTANGADMVGEYGGPTFSLGLHRSRLINVRGEYEPHAGTFSIEPVMDGLSQGGHSIAIGSGLATYGASVYGTATYGGAGRRMWHHMMPLSAEGRTVQLTWRYVGQEAFRVFTYTLGIIPETGARGFSE